MMIRGRLPFRLLACLAFAVVCLAPARSQADIQCTCRYAGQSYALGTCLCISRPGTGPQYACCGMVLNNTSWTFREGGCPVAMSVPVEPERAAGIGTGNAFGSSLESAPPKAAHQ